jgi:hypothetical protein
MIRANKHNTNRFAATLLLPLPSLLLLQAVAGVLL